MPSPSVFKELLLTSYQIYNYLSRGDSRQIISMKPGDMPAALASGSVDAISIFEPFAHFAEQQLGEDGITFTGDNLPSEIYVLDAHVSVKQDFKNLEKILMGLNEAERYIKDNPEEAKQIVIKYTKLDKDTLDTIWNNYEFEIALTTELIELWNKEARWAKDTGKVTTDTIIPNFEDVIFAEPLRNIKPEAVEF